MLLKNFNEHAFLHDLASVKLCRISLILSEDAWTFFDIFSVIVNKPACIKKMRIKNMCFERDTLGTRILRLTGSRSGK
jgi:hypothetical protein